MPKITDAEAMELASYRAIGTPTAVGKKINELEKDNRKQREEISTLKENAPEEGQLLISKEDGAELTAFKELGKSADVKARLEAGDKASKDLQNRVTRDSAVAFAKAAGLAEEAVETLVAIPDLVGAVFEVRNKKEKNDKGQEVETPVPYITLAGENQSAMTFTDALEKIGSLKGLRVVDKKEPEKGQNFLKLGGPSDPGGRPDSIYDQIRQDAANAKKASEKQPQGKTVQERLGMLPAG